MQSAKPTIEVIEPPFNTARFKYLTNQAVKQFESSAKTRDQRYTGLEGVLMGLFRHAYQKGRNDERLDQMANITMTQKFAERLDD